ncbi:hypothetical protein [Actinomadura parmotrematis]|uniref:Type II secretion system protein n=1 Tax=Actinomadura parmotrematis TaxID=2864039 RepID=A0ABS7FQG7_9ACTN|nr:hypothetical protein [Actinomadura parmotrematis]MBW8481793.1 hypothetical protein [Actinomadura parmotrematis]
MLELAVTFMVVTAGALAGLVIVLVQQNRALRAEAAAPPRARDLLAFWRRQEPST